MKHLANHFTGKDADILANIAQAVKSNILSKEDFDKIILECSCVEAQRLASHIYNKDMDVRFVREIFAWVDTL